MSGVVSLISVKEGISLKFIESFSEGCQKKLSLIGPLSVNKWESDVWEYENHRQKLYFRTASDEEISSELVTLAKVFLIEFLWNSRLRSQPYSFSHIKNNLYPIRILSEMGLSKLSDINQYIYQDALLYLGERYAEPSSIANALNRLLKWCNDELLLDTQITLANVHKLYLEKDSHGRIARKDKMPSFELVRAIIRLKWAVEESYDGSLRCQTDLLTILTQAFQYGLGLRIGEVLRLPAKPLIERDGDMFCMVWSEKGSVPIARYVPEMWRPVLKDAVERILEISKPYRVYARELEDKGRLSIIQERLDACESEKQEDLETLEARLDSHLREKFEDAVDRWSLLKSIKDSDTILLSQVTDYLPVGSSSTASDTLYKIYSRWGIKITSVSLGVIKHQHTVTGRSLKNFIREVTLARKGYILPCELFEIIHGSAPISRIKYDYNQRLNGKHFVFTFLGCDSGSSVRAISKADARVIIKQHTHGGYDTDKYICLRDLETFLPEFFKQKTSSRFTELRGIRISESKTRYIVKTTASYRGTKGWLVEKDSLNEVAVNMFDRSNKQISADIVRADSGDAIEAVNISSSSFSIDQKVSDFLFLRAGSSGGQYNEYIPQILSYSAVQYFFKPSKDKKHKNAFERYDIDVEEHVIESWQSHQGRHWKTTSLFRAGLPSMVVNKWMGRTQGQGDHYDHNTGAERAAKISEAMLEDTSRFLGDIPDKVREWKAQEIPVENISKHLNRSFQSIQYSPIGHCTRDLYLKPCEYNLMCLTGNDGKGCKFFIFDLKDPAQREKIQAEHDKSSVELGRLFKVLEEGVVAAEMHIEHHIMIVKNTTAIIKRADLLQFEERLESLEEFRPFEVEGSYPDDCPFQCGDSD